MELLYRWAYGTDRGNVVSAGAPSTCRCICAVMQRRQTLLDVGRGAEDVEPLQNHADGAQLTVHPLQSTL